MTKKAESYTTMGGKKVRFQTTRWTVIGEIDCDNPDHSRQVINDLIKDYWKPVYCYIRRKGYGNDQSKDMTQGFFQEVVLGRKLVQRADPNRGRFRTLLLTALDHHLANLHRNQNVRKRIPADHLIPLDHVGEQDLPEVQQGLSCEDSFNYAWVSQLLDRLISEVQADCRNRSMQMHWCLFYERIVQPILEDKDPPSIRDLCARHGVMEATKASNMIFAVKRRFQAALKRYLRQSVASDGEMGEEMSELLTFLKK